MSFKDQAQGTPVCASGCFFIGGCQRVSEIGLTIHHTLVWTGYLGNINKMEVFVVVLMVANLATLMSMKPSRMLMLACAVCGFAAGSNLAFEFAKHRTQKAAEVQASIEN